MFPNYFIILQGIYIYRVSHCYTFMPIPIPLRACLYVTRPSQIIYFLYKWNQNSCIELRVNKNGNCDVIYILTVGIGLIMYSQSSWRSSV